LPTDAFFAGKSGCDLVHVFAESLAVLKRDLPKARAAIAPNGAVWVSWYKKSSKTATDLTEEGIRAVALKTDLVDIKVCAVTDQWSGLKLVIRKHLR
jgi:hypothetical protein